MVYWVLWGDACGIDCQEADDISVFTRGPSLFLICGVDILVFLLTNTVNSISGRNFRIFSLAREPIFTTNPGISANTNCL
jgi:hypothetical protein